MSHTPCNAYCVGNNSSFELSSMSEFSLTDLANMHFAGSSSLTNNDGNSEVIGGGKQVERDTSSLSTDGLSLTDLANVHKSNLVTSTIEETPDNLSLTEIASVHMLPYTADTGHSRNEDITSCIDMKNVQLASLDFTSGFTTPKTGSTLSLSQLAIFGSTSTSGKSSKLNASECPSFQNNTGGLATLAAAHLNSSEIACSLDLSTLKLPPGLVPSQVNNVINSSQEIPLTSIVDKLIIKDTCVSPTSSSQFATIICISNIDKPKRLVKRHNHLRRKSWKTLINPYKKHIQFFTFTNPSPDDYVIQKQRQLIV